MNRAFEKHSVTSYLKYNTFVNSHIRIYLLLSYKNNVSNNMILLLCSMESTFLIENNIYKDYVPCILAHDIGKFLLAMC